jgi:NAD(P)-dependent dehydrogenase (short-subunit alcohol dehydrogenase family)
VEERKMSSLKGRVALVTGAGPNIGRAIATTLAQAGAFVLCNDVDQSAADGAARSAIDAGGSARSLPLDITNPEAVHKAVAEASAQHGLIDILVNNAAITIPKGILDISYEEWCRVIEVNLTGMFLCCQAVAKRLVGAKKTGAIVNIASTSGHRGRRNAIAYCTSKGGVLNLTRAMAVDLAPYGIRVNSVTPTKTGQSVGSIEKAGVRLFDEIPLGRLGDPQDQANAVLFMVSDEAAFVTGTDLRVDGGAICTWGAKTIAEVAKPAA